MTDTCISFICKEDLSKSNKYTTLAKINIEFWSKYYPTYVLSNNINEFKELKCDVIYDDTYFSQFNKFDLIDKLQKKYKKVIYLDCDNLFFDFNINLEGIAEGMHTYGDWAYKWGDIKKLDYFKIWRKTINVDDDIFFPQETVFILNTNNKWDETYKKLKSLREISNRTEIESTSDENPHHGVERCEAIGIYIACQTSTMSLHLNSDYVKQFYDAIKFKSKNKK